jgi:NAD(P)-dependent dehydrogenase (short-subunit alcohol dehydrogenase family)
MGRGIRDILIAVSIACLQIRYVRIHSSIRTSFSDVLRHVSHKNCPCPELWAVVNNAGIATVGNMEWMSVQTIKRVFDVNTFGSVAVTNAFLPLLRKSRGRVVIVSSLAGMYAQSTMIRSIGL